MGGFDDRRIGQVVTPVALVIPGDGHRVFSRSVHVRSAAIALIIADHGGMNSQDSNRHPIVVRAADPMDHVARRVIAAVAVGGALLGLLAASALENSGASSGLAIGIGLLVFGIVAFFASTTLSRTRAVATAMARNDRALEGWAASSQLGPDPEQVIGRRTGART
jgi:hypothetical protein